MVLCVLQQQLIWIETCLINLTNENCHNQSVKLSVHKKLRNILPIIIFFARNNECSVVLVDL